VVRTVTIKALQDILYAEEMTFTSLLPNEQESLIQEKIVQ
jgi:hypothetical protein